MIRQLRLQNFKNFRDATLELAPFTILVGANASGKSNLRDAFRVLHGIGRGYSLADIFGEKYTEGGELVWRGVRGGATGAVRRGESSFALRLQAEVLQGLVPVEGEYHLEAQGPTPRAGLRVQGESLSVAGGPEYDSAWPSDPPHQTHEDLLTVRFRAPGRRLLPVRDFPNSQPVLCAVAAGTLADGAASEVAAAAEQVRQQLLGLRAFEPDPEACRRAAVPGQTHLGDRGENLAAVLQALCAAPAQRAVLLSWLRELTPMDAVDLEFPADPAGRIIVQLVEADGQHTTAYSASDGTLRFLAYLALLLGPTPPRLVFLEEIENGIHPARLQLLVDLIDRQTSAGRLQVVATTHSAVLLQLLGPDRIGNVRLIHRPEGSPDAEIRPALSLPDAERVLREHNPAELMAAGWFETAAEFGWPAADDEVGR
ncbi:MAG: AAA family ATPase [Fimbriimonadaceae bacterium]|nr:AAA family ATPase [Fimbriimonadaceae bacterium]